MNPGNEKTSVDKILRSEFRAGLIILAVWALLAELTVILKRAGVLFDVPDIFPLSVFSPALNWQGLPYLAAFAALITVAVRFHKQCGPVVILFIGTTIVLVGNLMQGGIDEAFYRPIYGAYHGLPAQYFHDASRIPNWRDWLASFNQIQSHLQIHGRTHPPFAILVHYFLMGRKTVLFETIAFPFILFSCLSILWVWQIFRAAGIDKAKSNLLALFFACLPAVNIYSAVSLDAVIASFCALFMLGIALLATRGIGVRGVLCCAIGFTGANLLTFGGVFLAAFAVALGAWQVWRMRRWNILIALAICLVFFAAILAAMLKFWHYDHICAFLTASRLENTEGFLAFVRPADYVWTRLEDVCEIALFLGIPTLAVLAGRRLNLTRAGFRDFPLAATAAGVIVIVAMFLAGAYCTGETARACLFLYPLLVLPFARADERTLRALLIAAAAQTAIMQLFGDYFW